MCFICYFDIFYVSIVFGFLVFCVLFYVLAGWPGSDNWKDALAGWRAAPKSRKTETTRKTN